MINEKADQILYLMAHAMLIHLRDRNHDTPSLIAQARQSAELAAGEINPEMLPHTKAAQPAQGEMEREK
jgi:hypothetical protein